MAVVLRFMEFLNKNVSDMIKLNSEDLFADFDFLVLKF